MLIFVNILEILILFIYLYLEAKPDANLLNSGAFIYEHTTRYCRRLIVVILLSWANSVNLEMILLSFLSYSLIFAALFDNTLNVLREKPLFHLGRTTWWDRNWRKYPQAYRVFVIISLITGLSIIINLKILKLII